MPKRVNQSSMKTTSQKPSLPHESSIPFITDGGLETTLVFHEKIELPCFIGVSRCERCEGDNAGHRFNCNQQVSDPSHNS